MAFLKMTLNKENLIIKFGIIIFWWLFWLLNVVDKFIQTSGKFWVGKDRGAQFVDYFTSSGIEDPAVATYTLGFVTILEIIALIFGTIALLYFFKSDRARTRGGFFWVILTSLIIFSFFAVGDQIFGDRVELLEHSTYWIALIISWFVYTHADEKN